MRFLSALKTGVTVEIVASDFIRILITKSNELEELCVDSAAEFVNECFLAIGLKCSITVEQIYKQSYEWPHNQIRIYSFHHNKLEFSRFEKFLIQTSVVVDRYQMYFKEQSNRDLIIHEPSGKQDQEDSPIQLWMELISIWCNVYKHLALVEKYEIRKRFEEPLARINYHLLLGLHNLRKIYRQEYPILDSICHRLFCSATQGLYYKETHYLVLDGLLLLLNRDIHLITQPSTDVFNFYYQAFSVANMAQTHMKVYGGLHDALKDIVSLSYDAIEQPHRNLIDYLIKPHMLEVYFTTLMQGGKSFEKKQLVALNFLQQLQKRLLTMDCFNRTFVEAIFHLAGRKDEKLSNAAADLYITIMKKKVNNEFIVRHIVDAYIRKLVCLLLLMKSGSAPLKAYIAKLYKYFDYLGIYKNYLEIILNNETPELLRLLLANILVIVFHIDVTYQAKRKRNDLQHLLLILPEIFENNLDNRTLGILLQVYDIYDVKQWNHEICNNFIHYTIGVFLNNDNHFNYTLLMNIFIQFNKSQQQLKNYENFNSLWEHISFQVQHFNTRLTDNPNEELTDTLLQNYSDILKRLNILLKIDHPIQQNINTIAKDLLLQFTTKSDQQKQLISDNYYMDTYALEAINSCIMKMYNISNDEQQREAALQYAQILRTFIWNNMKNINVFLKYPIRRIRTYFIVSIALHCALPLELETEMYKYFVEVLISLAFSDHLYNIRKYLLPRDGINSLEVINIQKQMIRQFIQLHTVAKIKIDTNIVWKLCIHYHYRQYKCSNELKNLIIALAKYHFKIYKHIIPVIIYNIYKIRPINKQTQNESIIREHRRLIFEEIAFVKPELMCIHIVLVVLQMIYQAVRIQPIKMKVNRLEAISHLSALLKGFDLEKLQVAQLIEQELKKISELMLTSVERESLKSFKKSILTIIQLSKKKKTK